MVGGWGRGRGSSLILCFLRGNGGSGGGFCSRCRRRRPADSMSALEKQGLFSQSESAGRMM